MDGKNDQKDGACFLAPPDDWRFFTGMWQLAHLRPLDRAFISFNLLRNRRSLFAPPKKECVIDSAGFTIVNTHGGYPDEPEDYALNVMRFRAVGNLSAIVTQDMMCEPFVLAKTGLTIPKHQEITIERTRRIQKVWRDNCDDDIVMPVVQGWAPQDYANHAVMYDGELKDKWIGIGSVCKRQGDTALVLEIIDAVLGVVPTARIHLFGLKKAGLKDPRVRKKTASGDSMAWSYRARMDETQDGNDYRLAYKFERDIMSLGI